MIFFFLINSSGNFFPSKAQSTSGKKKKREVGSFIGGGEAHIYNEIMPNPKLKYLQDSPLSIVCHIAITPYLLPSQSAYYCH